jgi:hypothetical protein
MVITDKNDCYQCYDFSELPDTFLNELEVVLTPDPSQTEQFMNVTECIERVVSALLTKTNELWSTSFVSKTMSY